MESEIKNLKESVLSLTSEFSKDDIRIKLLNIEYILTDYNFIEDLDELGNLTPVDVLNNYLETFYLKDENERLFSEWFAVLSLYWLNKVDHDHPYKGRLHNFSNHAHGLALNYKQQANHIDDEIKRRKTIKNSKVNIELNKKKYAPSRRLKRRAFKEYKVAYKQLRRDGKRVTYRAIAFKVWPKIKGHNVHPVTGGNIIGSDTEHNFPDDVIELLIRWFGEGVRDKKTKSPRVK